MKRLTLLACFFAVACSAPSPTRAARAPTSEYGSRPLSITSPQGPETIEANWKERMTQPYVFLEHQGDYRRLGDVMRQLFAEAESIGLTQAGAPFALFFDDPGRVATEELRARACLPVGETPDRLGTLRFDLLPRAMVVYAQVSGAYPEAPRSYPALFSYLRELGWQQGGPIREVYLVNPTGVESYEQLVTEVQIPWAGRAAE